jgi:DNA-binding transcriptional MerR regulator
MNTAQTKKLLTLKEAADRLGVSIETLLSWNQENILKPIITQEGAIAYTQNQLDQFLTIRKIIQETSPKAQTDVVQIQTAEPSQYVTPENPIATPQPMITLNPANELPKASYIKAPSPILTLSVAATIVVLSAAILPQQGLPTSRLTLSEKFNASLPIQLRNETAPKRNLQSVAENISKEKITAPALYETKSETNSSDSEDILAMSSSQRPTGEPQAADIDQNAVPYSYSSSTYLSDNTSDEASAIDKHGTIRGETNKTDRLAIFMGGREALGEEDVLSQINANATNQLIFLFAGALATLFILQKQFAFPTKKLQLRPIDSSFSGTYQPMVDFNLQKALEIDQKTDGTVVLYVDGKEYKISKPEMNSESDQFIERLMTLTQSGVKEIEYDTSDTMSLTTPLSRLVTRLGFVGIKRDLFFPRTSKTSVLFRRYLTQQDLSAMNLTTNHILNELAVLS